jgi:hypothetical protein
VLLDGSWREEEGGRDAGVGPAFGHEGEHVAFARGERVEGSGVPAGGQQLADHFPVQGATADRDPSYGVGECADIGDPVLEQVADACRAAVAWAGPGC